MDRFLYYIRSRLFEALMAGAALLMSALIMIWPGSVAASAFRYLLQIVSAETLWIAFFATGVTSIVALYANGHWPVWGSRLRGAACAVRAMIWFQMDLALFVLLQEGASTVPSPGIPVYFILTLGEIISCYWALKDDPYRP